MHKSLHPGNLGTNIKDSTPIQKEKRKRKEKEGNLERMHSLCLDGKGKLESKDEKPTKESSRKQEIYWVNFKKKKKQKKKETEKIVKNKR